MYNLSSLLGRRKWMQNKLRKVKKMVMIFLFDNSINTMKEKNLNSKHLLCKLRRCKVCYCKMRYKALG